MLALTRGEGQSIIIDGQIEVKVVKWSRSSVRLAIQAPRSVTVDRDEIWRKMHPGELSPLEVAEKERNERFARETAAAGVTAGAASPYSPACDAWGGGGGSTVAGVFTGAAIVGGAAEVETVVGTIAGVDGVAVEVRAGVKGQVVRVLAENGKTVAAGEGVVGVKVSV